jgi:hypothetical protein
VVLPYDVSTIIDIVDRHQGAFVLTQPRPRGM